MEANSCVIDAHEVSRQLSGLATRFDQIAAMADDTATRRTLNIQRSLALNVFSRVGLYSVVGDGMQSLEKTPKAEIFLAAAWKLFVRNTRQKNWELSPPPFHTDEYIRETESGGRVSITRNGEGTKIIHCGARRMTVRAKQQDVTPNSAAG